MTNETRDAALEYAALGWRVHPLVPNGKKPLTKWTQAATTEEASIIAWWENWPDANVGIATGKDSIVVLDVDIKFGVDGHLTLLRLFNDHALIETLSVKTPSGGLHLYLKPDPDVEYRNAVGFAEGLDFRCDGGYVVAPPSQIGGVCYEWT